MEMDWSQDSIAWDTSLDIEPREVVAVEHPMIVKNLVNGLRTFGLGQPFDRILDEREPKGCIPLYIRPNDPLCTPLLSHNTATRNILLKITVPKRTGRKRKRGTDGPFLGNPAARSIEKSSTVSQVQKLGIAATGLEENGQPPEASTIRSQGRQDDPHRVLRTLQDKSNDYTVEAVGDIARTHRFRGVADFQHSTNHTEFMPKVRDLICSGEVSKMRQFQFNPKQGWRDNEDFIPPPAYTNEALPANWAGLHSEWKGHYAGIKPSSKPHQINYVSFDTEFIPLVTNVEPTNDPDVLATITKIERAFDQRPIWTRRALLSHLQFTLPKYYFDLALRYICYQFKSGPFREAIVRYGVDPRSGPEYAKYQTVIFADRSIKGRWADPRAKIEEMKGKIKNSHIFDGKNFVPDGSVYQICDITDPLITNMLDRCSFREKIDNRATGDGYFNNGVLAKIRIIIKAKMVAIMEGRSFTDEDFVKTIEFPDIFEDNKRDSRQILFLVPDIRPTEKEKRVLAIPRDAEVEELGNDARRRRKRKVEWNEDIRRSGGTKVRRQRILPGKRASSGADTKSATPQPAEKPGLDGTDDFSEDVEVGNDDAEGEEEDVQGRAMDGGDDDGDSSGTDVTDFRSLPQKHSDAPLTF